MTTISTENKLIVGADIPLDASRYPIKEILKLMHEACSQREDIHFVLAGKRHGEVPFSIWNFLDEHNLTDRVTYLPYYQRCEVFPFKRSECAKWISRNALPSELNLESLLSDSAFFDPSKNRTALFVTSFHLARQEGNTRNMRHWIRHLNAAGYRVHVLYYATDTDIVTPEMRLQAQAGVDLYREVPVTDKLYGINKEGLNVHEDDWCGLELLEEVSALVGNFEYDTAIVNYPFISAVFDRLASYTKKILFTHDSFTDRNRRMLDQGYTSAGWVSLDWRGEKKACERADIVVALQQNEADYFSELIGDCSKVRVVSPVFTASKIIPDTSTNGKLRIGYFGSRNWVNEQNLALFLRAWLEIPELSNRTEMVIAGGVCDDFATVVDDGHDLLADVSPIFLGRVEDIKDFFSQCDIIINPERGGTGIKIKTLEAMAAGMPVVCTTAGAAGIETNSQFHRAESVKSLAQLIANLANNPKLLENVQQDTADAYSRYVARNKSTMDDLLGAPDSATDYDSHRPLVSVIVPFYNVQAYIAECISSVLTQDHRNIELLLIDDASTDSSRAIADRYAKQDPRVRIITHNKNLGLGPARNTGARNASGSYFFFLDSDDYLASSSALRALVNSAQNNGHDVLIASCVSLTDDGKIIDHEKGHACGKIKAQGTDIGGMDAFLAVMGQSPKYYLPMRAWGTLIERNFYSALSLDYPPFEHEDIPHTPFMYASAKSLAFSEEVAVVYRTREGSISRTPWNARRIQRYRQMWNVFRENTQRFSLQDGLALSTIEMAGHMIWRMETNSFDSDGLAEAVSLLEEMMRDAARTRDLDKLWNFLDWTNRSLATWSGSHRSFAQIIAALPANLTVKYYERRLGVT